MWTSQRSSRSRRRFMAGAVAAAATCVVVGSGMATALPAKNHRGVGDVDGTSFLEMGAGLSVGTMGFDDYFNQVVKEAGGAVRRSVVEVKRVNSTMRGHLDDCHDEAERFARHNREKMPFAVDIVNRVNRFVNDMQENTDAFCQRGSHYAQQSIDFVGQIIPLCKAACPGIFPSSIPLFANGPRTEGVVLLEEAVGVALPERHVPVEVHRSVGRSGGGGVAGSRKPGGNVPINSSSFTDHAKSLDRSGRKPPFAGKGVASVQGGPSSENFKLSDDNYGDDDGDTEREQPASLDAAASAGSGVAVGGGGGSGGGAHHHHHHHEHHDHGASGGGDHGGGSTAAGFVGEGMRPGGAGVQDSSDEDPAATQMQAAQDVWNGGSDFQSATLLYKQSLQDADADFKRTMETFLEQCRFSPLSGDAFRKGGLDGVRNAAEWTERNAEVVREMRELVSDVVADQSLLTEQLGRIAFESLENQKDLNDALQRSQTSICLSVRGSVRGLLGDDTGKTAIDYAAYVASGKKGSFTGTGMLSFLKSGGGCGGSKDSRMDLNAQPEVTDDDEVQGRDSAKRGS